MFAIVGDNKSSMLMAEWDLLRHSETDTFQFAFTKALNTCLRPIDFSEWDGLR